jgi:hypothetical protein
MTDLAAPEAATTPAKATNTFFTETIVGRPVSLMLGRRETLRKRPGVDYEPRRGMRLAQFWHHDLENNQWRYAAQFGSPVQARAGAARLFLERHALRLALLALLVLVLAPLLYLASAWQMGMLDALLKQWGLL